jgi:hypothetical protein
VKTLILLAIFGLAIAACASGGSSPQLASPQANLTDVSRTETADQIDDQAGNQTNDQVDNQVSEPSAAAADDDDGIICRKEAVTGTYRRVRVCTTREQREASRESARELLRDVSRSAAPVSSEGQGG